MKYSASKYRVTLKSCSGVVQGHRKWRRSIQHSPIRLSIGPPLWIQLYLVLFLSYLTLNNIVTLKSRLEVIQTGTIWKLGCNFLVAFHSNYSSILRYFRHKARYWSTIVIFSYPPVRGGGRRNIAMPFGMEKLEWRGEIILMMCLFVLTQHTNMTDTQTDTAWRQRPRLMLASRGKRGDLILWGIIRMQLINYT